MSEVSRILLLNQDGTVSIQLHDREAYGGPKDQNFAHCRISATGVLAEYESGSPRLPWFRYVDRERAIKDLHHSGAVRALLEHVATTPVVDFGETYWVTIQWVNGQEPPYTTAEVSKEGGVIWDAIIPLRVDRMEQVRRIPKDDPDRKHRARTLLADALWS